jgi:hypothetical protein
MNNRNYWLLFAAVQAVGAVIPLLSKAHPSVIAGLVLLLPGDLIASVGGKLSPYLFYPLVFLINAGVWWLVKKILPSAESEPAPPANTPAS